MEWQNRISHALALEVPYLERSDASAMAAQAKIVTARGRQAAVLALLGFRDLAAEPEILLTRRADHLPMHPGQMAFPGGASDPEDHEDGRVSPVRTALRETHEEVGLPPALVEVVGNLPPLFTFSSDFWVTPVVGILRDPIESVSLVPSVEEIASLHWIPVSDLQSGEVHRLEPVEFGGRTYSTHVYQIQGQRIWGATAAMLHNLLERLSR